MEHYVTDYNSCDPVTFDGDYVTRVDDVITPADRWAETHALMDM